MIFLKLGDKRIAPGEIVYVWLDAYRVEHDERGVLLQLRGNPETLFFPHGSPEAETLARVFGPGDYCASDYVRIAVEPVATEDADRVKSNPRLQRYIDEPEAYWVASSPAQAPEPVPRGYAPC